MPRKQVAAYDLFKDFGDQLRRRADVVGLKNYEPMPMQQKFHNTDTQGRLFSGGNRAGKTVGGSTEAVMWLTGQHPIFSKIFPPPVYGRAVAVDFDKGVDRILLPEYKKWIEPEYLINGKWEDSYHKGTRTLTLTNGSTCEFMSYDQDDDKFAGTSRHFIHFDEEPPKSIFTECLARLIDTDGRWWMTVTPLIEFSWTEDDLFAPIRDGKVPFITLFEVPTSANVHIKSHAIEQLTFVMSDDEKVARTTGSGYSQSTRIFPEIGDYIIPPVDIKELRGWKFFTSLDHGLRNPTAILFFAVGPDDQIIVFDEYYHAERLVRENAKAYLVKVKELGIKINYMLGDPSTQNRDPITGTSIRQEYGENGVWYMLGNNDVRAGLLRVKSDFKNGRLKITENCFNTLREARSYKWKKPISSKVQSRTNLMEEPVKRNDHAMDALRYGIMSLPKTEKEEMKDKLERIQEIFPASLTASVWDKPIKTTRDTETGYFDEHLGYLE